MRCQYSQKELIIIVHSLKNHITSVSVEEIDQNGKGLDAKSKDET